MFPAGTRNSCLSLFGVRRQPWQFNWLEQSLRYVHCPHNWSHASWSCPFPTITNVLGITLHVSDGVLSGIDCNECQRRFIQDFNYFKLNFYCWNNTATLSLHQSPTSSPLHCSSDCVQRIEAISPLCRCLESEEVNSKINQSWHIHFRWEIGRVGCSYKPFVGMSLQL